MSHTGSTVPAIAQDGPSTKSGRDKHPDELLQSRGAAFVSSYTFTAINPRGLSRTCHGMVVLRLICVCKRAAGGSKNAAVEAFNDVLKHLNSCMVNCMHRNR